MHLKDALNNSESMSNEEDGMKEYGDIQDNDGKESKRDISTGRELIRSKDVSEDRKKVKKGKIVI